MKVKSFKGGFDDNFCYLIWCEDTMQSAIIDPSVDPLEIFEFIENNNIILSKIISPPFFFRNYMTRIKILYINFF